jgi:hypothetical protein
VGVALVASWDSTTPPVLVVEFPGPAVLDCDEDEVLLGLTLAPVNVVEILAGADVGPDGGRTVCVVPPAVVPDPPLPVPSSELAKL